MTTTTYPDCPVQELHTYWDGGDPFGSIMEIGFATATYATLTDRDVPDEIGFRLSPLHPLGEEGMARLLDDSPVAHDLLLLKGNDENIPAILAWVHECTLIAVANGDDY